MTLGFSTKWPKHMGELAGKPNYFPEKIHHSLMANRILSIKDRHNYRIAHEKKFGYVWDWDHPNIEQKKHTIREDLNNLWNPGMDIHMVINNRTKDRFQFAPVVKCVSMQDIIITEKTMTVYDCINLKDHRVFTVQVDGKYLSKYRIIELAINDGFDSVEDFFAYFNKDFKGKLIHWTNLKY